MIEIRQQKLVNINSPNLEASTLNWRVEILHTTNTSLNFSLVVDHRMHLVEMGWCVNSMHIYIYILDGF